MIRMEGLLYSSFLQIREITRFHVRVHKARYMSAPAGDVRVFLPDGGADPTPPDESALKPVLHRGQASMRCGGCFLQARAAGELIIAQCRDMRHPYCRGKAATRISRMTANRTRLALVCVCDGGDMPSAISCDQFGAFLVSLRGFWCQQVRRRRVVKYLPLRCGCATHAPPLGTE